MNEDRPAIAIVDDDELVRRALCRLVATLSYRAVAFASGEDFFGSLERAVPICAFVDLHMPGMGGIDVLAAMRSRRLSLPPIIIITGSEDVGARKRCLDAGAVGFLKKPIASEAIAAAIDSLPAR